MKSSTHIALATVLALALVAVVFSARRPREPVYQGRPLSVWLEDLSMGTDGVQHDQAVVAIQAIGTNCLPLISERLFYVESKFQQGLRAKLKPVGLGRMIPERQGEYHEQALRALECLGPVATPLVPELKQKLGELRFALTATRALGKIGGPSARRELALASTNASPVIRAWVASALKYGPPTNLVHQVLAALLNDYSMPVRMAAMRSLAYAQQHKEAAASLLLGVTLAPVYSGDEAIAAYALGKLGPVTTNVIPTLKRLMDDDDQKVAQAAAEALQKIQRDHRFRLIP